MNKHVHQTVRETIKRRGLRQVQLARELDMNPDNLSRLLSGRVNGITPSWQRLLEHLGLEVRVVPKAGEDA